MKAKLFIGLLITLVSCNNQSSHTATEITNSDSSATETAHVAVRDSSYDRFHIDTSKTFASDEERRKYCQNMIIAFDKFSRDTSKTRPDDLLLAWQLDSVSRVIYDQQGYLIFKDLWEGEKNAKNIFLISYNQVFSKYFSFEDRMKLFNAFPEEARKSPAGIEALKMLNKYENRKNIGKDMTSVGELKLYDTSFHSLTVNKAIENTSPYSIVIFTASWCSPCRYEARLIKKNMHDFDTSKIKFYSISIDKSRDKWMGYVRKEKSPWPQYLTEGEYESPLFKKIELSSLPLTLLLDKHKTIIDEDVDIERMIVRNPEAFGKGH